MNNFRNKTLNCYLLQKFFPIFYYTTYTYISFFYGICIPLIFLVLLWRAWHQNVFQQDGEFSTSESEPEFNNSLVPVKNYKSINHWLPPARLVKSQFNAIVSYIDMECHVYLQNLDSGIKLITNKIVFILI